MQNVLHDTTVKVLNIMSLHQSTHDAHWATIFQDWLSRTLVVVLHYRTLAYYITFAKSASKELIWYKQSELPLFHSHLHTYYNRLSDDQKDNLGIIFDWALTRIKMQGYRKQQNINHPEFDNTTYLGHASNTQTLTQPNSFAPSLSD